MHFFSLILLLVGGLNWGLMGLGQLMGNDGWNVVHKILGGWPTLEALVYLLVGLAAVYELATHKKNCRLCEKSGDMK